MIWNHASFKRLINHSINNYYYLTSVVFYFTNILKQLSSTQQDLLTKLIPASLLLAIQLIPCSVYV